MMVWGRRGEECLGVYDGEWVKDDIHCLLVYIYIYVCVCGVQAYVDSFSQALHYENRHKGICVQVSLAIIRQ